MKPKKLFKLSTLDGSSCAMMIGLGETFFPALLLALTQSSINAGLVVTVPLFLASILQILLFSFRSYFLSHRYFVSTFAFLQGVTLLVLSSSLFLRTTTSTLFVFGCATLYWSFGQAAGPIWNAWLSSLVPESNRLSFFSKREKWCQLATTVALLGGGFFLEDLKAQGQQGIVAFAVLFSIAGLLRLVSASLLYLHPDSTFQLVKEKNHEPKISSKTLAVFQWIWAQKHIFGFLFILKMSVYFASSYFSPYMLKDLKLSYMSYTILLTIALLSRVFTMHFTQTVAKSIGVKWLLFFSTLSLAAVPALWVLSRSGVYISALHVLSGMSWACFDFSILIYLMNTVEHSARTKILVGINFFYAFAAIIGSIMGASFLSFFGESTLTYHHMFEISSLMRFTAVLLIPAFFRKKITFTDFTTRIVAIRPSIGAQIRPLFPKSIISSIKVKSSKGRPD